MDIVIRPGQLSGSVDAIPSKSLAHRFLISAAFADSPTELICPETNRDIEATADCLRSLGAGILRTDTGYRITPANSIPREATLNCGESGATLRFLLPVAGALGVTATFHMEGRLSDRPLSPLWEEMERMGCCLSRSGENTILCRGKLKPGAYSIAGNVSSQFVSGLLLALNLMENDSGLQITGSVESAPYIKMTRSVLKLFGPQHHSPGTVFVEGDWSNAAFWLAAAQLGNDVSVNNLNPDSLQGDRACAYLLPKLKQNQTISAADIPDLIPILSIVAAANCGAVFTDIQRLRLKESDRVLSIVTMINNLGGHAEATEDTLTISGTGLRGGRVSGCNDHRIAMSAAIASTVCKDPVVILGAECVSKSYPGFWDEFIRLGGYYEQYLR